MRKIVVAVGGSSGAIYAQRLLHHLSQYNQEGVQVDVVLSPNAIVNWELEIGPFNADNIPFKIWKKDNFFAPFASGSAKYDSMVICPSSMGLCARIASGISDDLITRAADVMLKERRKLVIIPREMPYNLIHLRNLTTLTEAGAIICPASPSFYSKPDSIEAVVDTVIYRVLDLLELPNESYRWGK